MKSAKQNILEFLQKNHGVFHNGDLQRKEFKNKNGSLATGDTIKRRLQNLAEEGLIHVQEIGGHAHYSATPIEKPKPVQTYVIINGQRVAVSEL